jgi:Asp-tRNA(Asn)/Glu-tRNA(Gln) amidotransferase A subunit family amidase
MDAEMKAGETKRPLRYTSCNKDNIDTADKIQTCGVLAGGNIASKDTFVVETQEGGCYHYW